MKLALQPRQSSCLRLPNTWIMVFDLAHSVSFKSLILAQYLECKYCPANGLRNSPAYVKSDLLWFESEVFLCPSCFHLLNIYHISMMSSNYNFINGLWWRHSPHGPITFSLVFMPLTLQLWICKVIWKERAQAKMLQEEFSTWKQVPRKVGFYRFSHPVMQKLLAVGEGAQGVSLSWQ